MILARMCYKLKNNTIFVCCRGKQFGANCFLLFNYNIIKKDMCMIVDE